MKLHDWVDVNKIKWYLLSQNPNAIDLLKENPDKINWDYLSKNPNAIDLLKENPEKIDWYHLSKNPSIFTYDYSKMTERPFVEELISRVYHPDKLVYYLDTYHYDIGEEEYV